MEESASIFHSPFHVSGAHAAHLPLPTCSGAFTRGLCTPTAHLPGWGPREAQVSAPPQGSYPLERAPHGDQVQAMRAGTGLEGSRTCLCCVLASVRVAGLAGLRLYPSGNTGSQN